MYPGDAGFRAAARESLTFSACGYQGTDVCVVDLETKKVTKSAEINKGINSSMFVTFGWSLERESVSAAGCAQEKDK